MTSKAGQGDPWGLVFRAERLLADDGPIVVRSLAEELLAALRSALFELERERQSALIARVEAGHAMRALQQAKGGQA